MNNFQKFQNKQLSVTKAAKIMGGEFYHACIYGSECLDSWYRHYNINCSISDWQCLNQACELAMMECELG